MTTPSNIPDGCEPFDLQRALAGVPVVTRDGQEIIQIAHFPKTPDKNARVVAQIAGEQATIDFSETGEFFMMGPSDGRDLFLRPEPRYVAWTLAEVPLGLQVKRTLDTHICIISSICPTYLSEGVYLAGWGWISPVRLLQEWTQLDGTPCGRREG